jgi:hypothetical protein
MKQMCQTCNGDRIIYRPVRTLTAVHERGTYFSWPEEKWLPILVEEDWEIGGIDACPECQQMSEAEFNGRV